VREGKEKESITTGGGGEEGPAVDAEREGKHRGLQGRFGGGPRREKRVGGNLRKGHRHSSAESVLRDGDTGEGEEGTERQWGWRLKKTQVDRRGTELI